MASSGKSKSTELESTVASALPMALEHGDRVLLGLSGGVDSVVLLVVLARLASRLNFRLGAIHVNHGISPNAGRWVEFCRALAREHQVTLQVATADLAPYRGEGIEAAARRARYELFAREDADCLVLAHHRDDQAETLLVQLLRGAGVAGLAGMPMLRALPDGRMLLRPLLGVSRAEIAAFARRSDLRWIEDESNADTRRQRNFIRHRVLPLLGEQVPAAAATIARTARLLGDAAALLEDLARIDGARIEAEGSIDTEGLRLLGAARAKNLIRDYCRRHGVVAPSAARLDELWRQIATARADAAVQLDLPPWRFRVFAGRLRLEPLRLPVNPGLRETWRGEHALPILALGGVVRFKPEEGRGVSASRLKSDVVTVRIRRGGERLQPDGRRPRRTLKNLLRERGVPRWNRDRLPLVYCGSALVCVPGVGEDCRWQAGPGEAGLIISWEPLADDPLQTGASTPDVAAKAC